MTDEERLAAENESLKALLNRFLAYRANGAYPARAEETWVNLKAHTVSVLRKIAESRPPRVKEDPIEKTSFYIRNIYARFFNEPPYIVLERPGKRKWEAFIDGHDMDIGVAEGETALLAMRHLHGRMKNFATVSGPTESDANRRHYRKFRAR